MKDETRLRCGSGARPSRVCFRPPYLGLMYAYGDDIPKDNSSAYVAEYLLLLEKKMRPKRGTR
ncbi:MAG: hypothetical protein ACYYK0_01570 [Candidatus Eutrophobiaceae bacterium]